MLVATDAADQELVPWLMEAPTMAPAPSMPAVARRSSPSSSLGGAPYSSRARVALSTAAFRSALFRSSRMAIAFSNARNTWVDTVGLDLTASSNTGARLSMSMVSISRTWFSACITSVSSSRGINCAKQLPISTMSATTFFRRSSVSLNPRAPNPPAHRSFTLREEETTEEGVYSPGRVRDRYCSTRWVSTMPTRRSKKNESSRVRDSTK